MAKLQFKDSNVVYEKIVGNLQKKEYKPLYLLMGEEDLYIDKICSMIENIHTEEEKVFDQTTYYVSETLPGTICDAARRYPMSSKLNIIIVKDAQNITNFDAFDSYLKRPNPSSILVLCCKGKIFDKRTGFYKLAQKVGEVYESGILYNNQISGWIRTYVKSEGYTIEEQAAVIMSEYLGNSLSKLANALEKLFITIGGKKNITTQDVEQNIGISKDYNRFELSEAVMQKKHGKTYEIVQYFKDNPADNPFILSINALFLRVNKSLLYCLVKKYKYNGSKIPDQELREVVGIEPYFRDQYETTYRLYTPTSLIKVVELLREFDLKSKGFNNTSTEDGDLLHELCFKIMH